MWHFHFSAKVYEKYMMIIANYAAKYVMHKPWYRSAALSIGICDCQLPTFVIENCHNF